ncbi:MAG: hypothetical protein N3D81_00155, partial [Spirochaetes bacterium]|nr:hypothetical protein [Spirochaetota bacterium]
DPFAMGWEPDELLISPTNVLNKPLNAIVDQNDLTNNGGRMLTYFGSPYQNKCEPTNDSAYPGRETDTLTKAELSELWFTWDTNAIYFAVKGQTAGRRNNLMIYFDREPNKGRTSFVESVVHWNRGVFFSGFDPDMYIGFWNPNDKVEFDINPDKSKGGVQLLSIVGSDEDAWMSSYNDGGLSGTPNMNTNIFNFFFNGEFEPDMFKRVVIGKIAWSFFFTNVNPTNMWLKIAVATTGPDSGNYNYEYMPDNSTPVNPSFKSVEDNFVMIRVTDGDGKPRIGVNVRNEAYINFYPGVKIEADKSPRFYMKVVRGGLSGKENDAPKVFAPAKGDKVRITIGIEKETDFFAQGYIKIYDERGNLVRTIAENINLSKNMQADAADDFPATIYDFPYTFIWDGKDDKGNIVPMGNYFVVVAGKNISALDMIGARLITVIH